LKLNRIGLSIVALQTVLESITEHIAIIDKPEELKCGGPLTPNFLLWGFKE
jgi:hypothetical protein